MAGRKARVKKVAVETLQEEYLSGPADEPIEKIQEEMAKPQKAAVKEPQPMERITFRNQRDPGSPLEFHYASKTSPFKMYKLVDGQSYSLPREVVKNLEGCRENIQKYRRNAEGLPEAYISGFKTHFVCERA